MGQNAARRVVVAELPKVVATVKQHASPASRIDEIDRAVLPTQGMYHHRAGRRIMPDPSIEPGDPTPKCKRLFGNPTPDWVIGKADDRQVFNATIFNRMKTANSNQKWIGKMAICDDSAALLQKLFN